VGRRLKRWIACACRTVADRLDPSRVAEPTPAPIELSGSVVRAGCLLPMDRLADEIELRDALRRSIRRFSPAFEPGQA
jgi:hypothetical protein